MAEIIAGKQNIETERDYGTNCRDCERFQRVGEVCVIEHGKRFLWEYCRDFEAKVELPDYNELMKTVKQEHVLQRHKEREKKEREKKQRLKEREAKKELVRRARIARARRKYFVKLKKKKAASEKRKKAREIKKKQESLKQVPTATRRKGADSKVAMAVASDLKVASKLGKTRKLMESNSKMEKGTNRKAQSKKETEISEAQTTEKKSNVTAKQRSSGKTLNETPRMKENPEEHKILIENDITTADRQQF